MALSSILRYMSCTECSTLNGHIEFHTFIPHNRIYVLIYIHICTCVHFSGISCSLLAMVRFNQNGGRAAIARSNSIPSDSVTLSRPRDVTGGEPAVAYANTSGSWCLSGPARRELLTRADLSRRRELAVEGLRRCTHGSVHVSLGSTITQKQTRTQ